MLLQLLNSSACNVMIRQLCVCGDWLGSEVVLIGVVIVGRSIIDLQ